MTGNMDLSRLHLHLLSEMARSSPLTPDEISRLRSNLAAGGVKGHQKARSGAGRKYQKTVCASAVAAYFGVSANQYRKCMSMGDLKRILNRSGRSVRSRKSKYCRKPCTVSRLRKMIAAQKSHEVGDYLVYVDRHVLVLGRNGEVLVDTDPRKADRRKVLRVYLVSKARGL